MLSICICHSSTYQWADRTPFNFMSAMTFDDDTSDSSENDDGSCVALTITGRKGLLGRSRTRTQSDERQPFQLLWRRIAFTEPNEGLNLYAFSLLSYCLKRIIGCINDAIINYRPYVNDRDSAIVLHRIVNRTMSFPKRTNDAIPIGNNSVRYLDYRYS